MQQIQMVAYMWLVKNNAAVKLLMFFSKLAGNLFSNTMIQVRC